MSLEGFNKHMRKVDAKQNLYDIGNLVSEIARGSFDDDLSVPVNLIFKVIEHEKTVTEHKTVELVLKAIALSKPNATIRVKWDN